jgi:L-ascorbate metabolism protein UlaG (beta-lactamase superfamily)
MTIKTTFPLRRLAAAVACAASLGGCAVATPSADATVGFQQIRNATIKLEYAGTTFLVDPMLARKGAYPGFPGTYNSHLRNPLVDLPLPLAEVMRADAIIVTHTHLDHWDDAAKRSLPKAIPIFAQNEQDAQSIRQDGFTNVSVLGEGSEFRGTRLSRTEGQHGSEQIMQSPIGPRLGTVSGVVFSRPGHKTVYVAGDTVWNGQVEAAIATHRPDVIILNTGYARIQGMDGAIIMGKEDLLRARQLAPHASVIGSHMESVNHATQSRQDLRDYIAEKGLDPARVLVPADGQSYRF